MRGEYDDELEWPFEGSITVDLLNQQEDKGHHSRKLIFNRFTSANGRSTSRVFDEAAYGVGCGNSLFISHTDLSCNSTTNTEYLQNDCLRLRVSDVFVYSTDLLHKTPSWQDPLTLLTSQCVSSHSQNSPNASSYTTYITVHHFAHTHRVINCASVCMLMLTVEV